MSVIFGHQYREKTDEELLHYTWNYMSIGTLQESLKRWAFL